jgi:hypothetical protein
VVTVSTARARKLCLRRILHAVPPRFIQQDPRKRASRTDRDKGAQQVTVSSCAVHRARNPPHRDIGPRSHGLPFCYRSDQSPRIEQMPLFKTRSSDAARSPSKRQRERAKSDRDWTSDVCEPKRGIERAAGSECSSGIGYSWFP